MRVSEVSQGRLGTQATAAGIQRVGDGLSIVGAGLRTFAGSLATSLGNMNPEIFTNSLVGRLLFPDGVRPLYALPPGPKLDDPDRLANLTMSSRHFMGKLTIPKAAGNGLFVGPRDAALADLVEIQAGRAMRDGTQFTTSSGRTWGVHDNTVHPISGPDVVNVSAQEYKILAQAQREGLGRATMTLENLAQKGILNAEQVTRTQDLMLLAAKKKGP